MLLGTVVGLGPGHIVLDGDAAPPTERDTTPTFRPMSIVERSPISATVELLLYMLWTPLGVTTRGASLHVLYICRSHVLRRTDKDISRSFSHPSLSST